MLILWNKTGILDIFIDGEIWTFEEGEWEHFSDDAPSWIYY